MEGLKDTCGDDLDAVWLLHILRRIRQMYASLIHLDLPNEALDIFGKFILNLRYKILLLFYYYFLVLSYNEFKFFKLGWSVFIHYLNKRKQT